MILCRCLSLTLLLSVVLAPAQAWDEAEAHEKTLRSLGIKTDQESLLQLFRKRIVDREVAARIDGLIKKLGARRYRDREEAQKELLDIGVTARPMLTRALESKDAEIARRARECLGVLKREGGPAPLIAAAQLLASTEARDAIPIFLEVLPFLEENEARQQILWALADLVPEEGEGLQAVRQALTADAATTRAAAAFVLGSHPKEALRAEVRPLLKDEELEVRFRAAMGLLRGEEKIAMPPLLALLEDAPREIAWEIEDLLFRLAGEEPPNVSLGTTTQAEREDARKQWEQWWAKNETKVSLAQLTEEPRSLGLTLGIEYNTNRIWECNRAGKILWEIPIQGAMDAQVLPGRRVLVGNRDGVAIYDTHGELVRYIRKGFDANGCRVLKNGNIFMSGYGKVLEVDPQGKEIYNFTIPGSNGIHKAGNGNILYVTGSDLVEITTEKKEVRKIHLGKKHWTAVKDLPGDRFLVATSSDGGYVMEINGKGTELWRAKVTDACGVVRLPNGSTLVAARGRTVEINRAGKTVWEKESRGYVRRVRRR